MATFLKIIQPNSKSHIDLRNLEEDSIISSRPYENMLINLDEVSNIKLSPSPRGTSGGIELVIWTSKIGFTWNFTSSTEAIDFYQTLEEKLPMTGVTAKLRGFSNAE